MISRSEIIFLHPHTSCTCITLQLIFTFGPTWLRTYTQWMTLLGLTQLNHIHHSRASSSLSQDTPLEIHRKTEDLQGVQGVSTLSGLLTMSICFWTNNHYLHALSPYKFNSEIDATVTNLWGRKCRVHPWQDAAEAGTEHQNSRRSSQ